MRRALLSLTAARFRKGFGSCGALPCGSRHYIGDEGVLLEPSTVPIPRAVLLAHGDRYEVAAFKAFAARKAPVGRLRRAVARYSTRDPKGPCLSTTVRVFDAVVAVCVAAAALLQNMVGIGGLTRPWCGRTDMPWPSVCLAGYRMRRGQQLRGREWNGAAEQRLWGAQHG